MLGSILTILFFVTVALTSVVTLHLGFLSLRRISKMLKSNKLAIVILLALIFTGSFGLWKAIGFFFGQGLSVEVLPLSLKVGAIFLYLACCLVYIEIRSSVARGYSLRILIDILNGGGSVNVDLLQSSYGGGVGIRGMLSKRLSTLSTLHLVRLQGSQVGPLTLFGKICAVASSSMRHLLRLEQVG